MASYPRYRSQILYDKQRSGTRVNIGDAFEGWCQLKRAKGLKSHAEVAAFLLYSQGPNFPRCTTDVTSIDTACASLKKKMVAVDSTLGTDSSATGKQPSTTQSPLESGIKKKKVLSAASLESKARYDKSRAGTRINVGYAHQEWRLLQFDLGLKTDADMAHFLVTRYRKNQPPEAVTQGRNVMRAPTSIKQTAANISHQLSPTEPVSEGCQSPPKKPRLVRNSSTESCETMDVDPSMMSSSNEAENDTTAASAQDSTHEKEQEKQATCQGSTNEDEQTNANLSENRDIGVKDEDEDEDDEEFSTSLSVADGYYQVDLGSSSEFIVDEECILELFKSCQKCNRQCKIRKIVKGLKLVVSQKCCFCEHHFEWTNLPDENEPDSDLQINEQNTEASPSNNIS